MANIQLTAEDLFKLRQALPTMPEKQKRETAKLLKEYEAFITQQVGKDSFLDFIKHVYPDYKVGPHHLKLIQVFEDIAAGKKRRVVVNIAPRHGKSELISYLAPAWFLGKHPNKKVIMASHTADLAIGFGRRVRNLVGSDEYKGIFPQIELQADSKSASRWGTNFNGEYFAIGVGGALAGRGADLFIIDDPHSEQDAKQNKASVFLPSWEWFQSGPIQRLMPGGAIIVVMCMTGDTPVLMASGEERQLKDIKPNDMVATYDNGKLSTTKVLNWKSNGIDKVYKIRMTSGKIVRANERHPFLVDDRGLKKWIRLKELKPGMSLVALKDVIDLQDHNLNPDYVHPAKLLKATTEKTPMPPIMGLGGTEKIKEKFVKQLAAMKQSNVEAYAESIIIKLSGTLEYILKPQKNVGPTELKVDMVSLWMNTNKWLSNKVVNALYAENYRQQKIQGLTGTGNYVLTIATILRKLEHYFVTTAISLLGTQKLKKQLWQLQNTSDFTLDKIIEITLDGEDEVFDVQIEGTENFIANGLVSHNTRWSKLDLTGQLISQMEREDGVDRWEIIEFPAIKEDDTPLWPEFWKIEQLLAIKAAIDIRYWNAQYLQQPTSEEGALIKREWWQIWEEDRPPQCEFTIMALDAAQETNNRADFNALTVWGVFFNEEVNNFNIILLDSVKKRMEFPELKALVLERYKEWEPDSFIVEKKSNGAALYQELRRMGVPVGEFTPGKGQDKISRVNAVSDLFASGIVWAPAHRWAKEVIEECNDFPAGANDDLVDSTTLALMRFRQGGFIRLPSDDKDDDEIFYKHRNRAAYY
jgi:predicted phage terminase large subunit-like protein